MVRVSPDQAAYIVETVEQGKAFALAVALLLAAALGSYFVRSMR